MASLPLALVAAIGKGLQTYGQMKKATDIRKEEKKMRLNEIDRQQEELDRAAEERAIERRQARADRLNTIDLNVREARIESQIKGTEERRKAQAELDVRMANPNFLRGLYLQGKLPKEKITPQLQRYFENQAAKEALDATDKSKKDAATTGKMDDWDKLIVDEWKKMWPKERAKVKDFKTYRAQQRQEFGVDTPTTGPTKEPTAAEEANQQPGRISTGHLGVDKYNNHVAPPLVATSIPTRQNPVSPGAKPGDFQFGTGQLLPDDVIESLLMRWKMRDTTMTPEEHIAIQTWIKAKKRWQPSIPTN